ncbi:VOC family protein [Ruania alba]|uniref:Glyoxalase-like domain-containing protein n=1 Tax=Ruania alba TaxID=648782 RepID=A0A1H5KVX5_9MICO|nr:VOC family protein [Ruania alba]SEE68999.1 Glyoxalase-like domain-containing protein [Ruania alba]
MSELDHLVYAGPDLQVLVEEVHELTGVRPVAGGSHEGRGTANALLGLGEGRYLELLGPDPEQGEPDRPRPLRVDQVTAPTMVGWAVRPTDIEAVAASARDSVYDPGPVAPMSRRTTDGDLLSWRLTPPEGGLEGAIPFLIDWQDTPHPSGALPGVELTSLTLEHPDPDQVRPALDALGALELVQLRAGERLRIVAELDTPRGLVHLG